VSAPVAEESEIVPAEQPPTPKEPQHVPTSVPVVEEFVFDEFSFRLESLKNSVEALTAAIKENTVAINENIKFMKEFQSRLQPKRPRFSRWDQVTGVDTAKQQQEFEFAWSHPDAGRNQYKSNPRF